jgi:nucleoside-diphosphate-sugar epimerase
MKILVTGGRGFVGKALSKKLQELGHEVETLSRSATNLDDTRFKHHPVDLTRIQEHEQLFHNVDCIFHVAAKAGVDGKYNSYYTVNYLGTKDLLKVSKKMGVKYFIYTSSPSVVFSKEPIANGKEDLPYVSNNLSPYSSTKAMAEKEVLLSNDTSFSTLALRPHLVWGEGDPHLLPKVINRHKAGKLKIVGDGMNRVDLTHIDNVVHAHIKALNALVSGHPVSGKSYFISQNEPVKLWEWLNSLFELLNLKPLEQKISFSKAYLTGAFLEKLWRFSFIKSEVPMSRFIACQLAHDHWFSTRQANLGFGYEPILSMDEAMNKTIPWLKTI